MEYWVLTWCLAQSLASKGESVKGGLIITITIHIWFIQSVLFGGVFFFNTTYNKKCSNYVYMICI